MSESFIYSCFNCGTELEVPIEFCGQHAECTECSQVFALPSTDEVQAAIDGQASAGNEVPEQAPTPVEEEEDSMTETGTVKIDRASIGMIPDVSDQFKVDFATMDSNPSIDAPKRTEEPEALNSDDISDLDIPARPTKKWWQFWK